MSLYMRGDTVSGGAMEGYIARAGSFVDSDNLVLFVRAPFTLDC